MSTNKDTQPEKLVPNEEPAAPQPNGPDMPPEMEELPEESQEENRPSIAAAVEKFKKYGAMRRDPNAEIVPVRKRLVNLPVRNAPFRDWFIRTSRNPAHRGVLPIFFDRGGDATAYLVGDDAQAFLPNRVANHDCVLTITRQSSLFLWCTPLENEAGEWNSWHSSAFDMKEVASASWIRVVGNRQINGYDPVDPEVARG